MTTLGCLKQGLKRPEKLAYLRKHNDTITKKNKSLKVISHSEQVVLNVFIFPYSHCSIFAKCTVNTYILFDDLVCSSIVGYFYESRCTFGEPVVRVKIQETSKKIPTKLHTKSSNKKCNIQLSREKKEKRKAQLVTCFLA